MFVRIHIVQKGETLWRIAKQYGVGLEELKHLNAHLTNPDYIVPGMEIILPDAVDHTTAKQNATMTKEQLTAPIATKEEKTAPTKEKLTEPIKEAPKKEAPIKEIAKEILTKPMPVPVPMPMPQLDLTPQFHFDFAPQMHFKQPEKAQPMPQPMPQPVPQPIYIEVPQMQMPQPPVETKIETKIEKEVEYVPVPQQQIIYVPYIPPFCHQPMPCHPKHHHPKHHHPCPPQPCHQFNPCGEYEMMPQQMEGFDFSGDYQGMPQQAMNDCGCGGSQAQHGMMPYDLPYFEPNYDVAPMMDVAPAMEMEGQSMDSLPDWLLDSSEMKKKTATSFGMEQQGMMTEQFGSMPGFEMTQYGNVDPMAYNYGNYSVAPNMGEQMTYMMPQQYMMMPQQYMMPQQFVQPSAGSIPYMNPHTQPNKPWTY